MLTNEEMIGMKFGRWTVLEAFKGYKNYKTYFKCQCSCGNKTIKMVYRNTLLNGDSQSCGCLNKEKVKERCRINRIGERFGMLVVKEMLYNYNGTKTYCKCDCDCGVEHIASMSNLVTGSITSCGCNAKNKCWDGRRNDLVGKRFGKLIVEEMLYGYRNKQTYCRCKCDCGNKTIVNMGNLLCGRTHSCRCSEHDSVGEQLIRDILNNNNILYSYNYSFDDCRDILPLPFDFYLPDYNTCIEYDGIQHFKPVEHFGGQEALEKTQNHDNIKTKYCIDNNITLIRLPYTLSKQEVENIILNIWNP